MSAKITLNPDKEYVRDIKKQLKANSGYCPCSLVKMQTQSVCAKSSGKWTRVCATAGFILKQSKKGDLPC